MTACICRPYPINGEPVHSIECLNEKHRAELDDNLPELPRRRLREAREQYREELANEPASKLDIEKAKEEARGETRESVKMLRDYVNDLRKDASSTIVPRHRAKIDESSPAGSGSVIAMTAAILALILSIIAITT